MVQGWHAAKVGLDRLLIPTAVVANLFRSARDFRRGAQPIRSSNSRSRLPRDQRSTTESTEIHGKENPNQLPLSVVLTVKIFEACADFLTPDGVGSCRKCRNFGAHRSLVQSCGCGLAALGFPWLPVCDDLSCLGNNTSSTGFSGWRMSVAVPRRQARLAREGALVDHQVPHPDHHPRSRALWKKADRRRGRTTSRVRLPFRRFSQVARDRLPQVARDSLRCTGRPTASPLLREIHCFWSDQPGSPDTCDSSSARHPDNQGRPNDQVGEPPPHEAARCLGLHCPPAAGHSAQPIGHRASLALSSSPPRNFGFVSTPPPWLYLT